MLELFHGDFDLNSLTVNIAMDVPLIDSLVMDSFFELMEEKSVGVLLFVSILVEFLSELCLDGVLLTL